MTIHQHRALEEIDTQQSREGYSVEFQQPAHRQLAPTGRRRTVRDRGGLLLQALVGTLAVMSPAERQHARHAAAATGGRV